MSDLFNLEAEIRGDMGKGASRRLRREGKVPAILYGGGRDSVAITLKHNQVLRQLQEEAFYSHILTIEAGGKSQQAILRDVQRHPFKPTILHMDFMRVTADSAIRVNVPLHFINEESCAGVKTGGTINHSATEVEVSCLPRYLPEYIEIDLMDIELGQTVHLSDLKLPEGVELTAFMHGGELEEHDQAVVSVNILRAAPAEDEEADIEAEPGVEGVEDQDQDQD